MTTFGERIRELRHAKRYSLRQLAPVVGVGFSYLSKVENGRLDFDGSPSEALIHRLADVLDADEDELLLLADKIPASIRTRIRQNPTLFRMLARLDRGALRSLERSLETGGSTGVPERPAG